MSGRMEVDRPQRKSAAADVVLNALPHPLLVIGPKLAILSGNQAAEVFFGAGQALLTRQALTDFLDPDCHLLALSDQALQRGVPVRELDVDVTGPRFEARRGDVDVVPLSEPVGSAALIIREQTITHRLDEQRGRQGSLRAASGMAAILAHEIKNPLSGIRGAAQLLESGLSEEDAALAVLIREETDRITRLIDRMDVFRDTAPPVRMAVNIHEVLGRVRAIAEAGFGQDVTLTEQYDPSLPAVYGDHDQLVQVFLNLVKNACEAAGSGGRVQLATGYRSGMRLITEGGRSRVVLPIEVSVSDDGPGISEDLRGKMFEPFISGRAQGAGLGLAIVAKIIGAHEGVVDYDSAPGRTVFRVRLPADDGAAPEAGS